MSVPHPTTSSGMFHPAWFEIDLGLFQHNLAEIRRKVGSSRICCVLKANAYGHGLVPIAKAAEACVDYFGVAHLQEAVALRHAGIKSSILVLGAIHEDQIEDLIRYQVEFTISSPYKARLVTEIAKRRAAKCVVHVEIDTGMRRTGVRVESAPALIKSLMESPYFELRGVYSHFAMSETPRDSTTLRQIEEFIGLKEKMGLGASVLWHLANSGGVAFYPESYLDMVRPGLMCYGLCLPGSVENLHPILSLKARVSYFKVVAAGEGISYNHTYRTARQCRMVTIPVGYGDGYRKVFSNRLSILLRNKRYPIAGSVCMDQFMVDIGDDEAYVGDEAVLIGKMGGQAIGLDEMASAAQTDPREILCHFNDRIPRIYL